MGNQFQWLKKIFTRKDISGYADDTAVHSSSPFLDREDNYLARIGVLLDEFMMKYRPYLLHGYTVVQLANDSGVSTRDLLEYFECLPESNFQYFINAYRIRHCQEFLKNTSTKNVSPFDLSIICGFDEEEEFVDTFKKVTGLSVSAYIKKELKPYSRFTIRRDEVSGY